MAKKKRPLKETIIFVGEGECEEAFLKHLKSIYGVGNPRVSPKSAGGKGPGNVIDDALGTLNSSGCDRVAALLDLDLPWPKTKVKSVERKKIILIGCDPCLESLLLGILGQKKPVPCNNQSCKAALHPQLDDAPTKKESYQKLFSRDVLEQARVKINTLDQIIKVIQGKLK